MRNLTHQEILNVHGGNFTEDITTLSASVYVSIQIGTAAGNITQVTLSALGFNQLTLLSNFLPTVAAVTLPLVIVGSILQANPQMQKILLDKCHFYFYGETV